MSEDRDTDLRQGARAAAAAAAVGAAVGVARALAARADDAAHRRNGEPEHEDAHEQEAHEEEHEDETVDDGPETAPQQEQQEQQQPEPEQKSVGAERLQQLTRDAREVLHVLSGVDVESVSGVDRTGTGWRITLEAVEVRRIPESTDVLATYDVELDDDGDLVRYERRRRYARAQADRGDER